MHRPTFVFLHGSPGAARIFDAVIARAPAGTRTVAVDLPDYGSSPDELAVDLGPFDGSVDRLIAQQQGTVVLVGYSFGALLAARALSRNVTASVERAVLVGGPAALPTTLAERNAELSALVRSRGLTPTQVADIANDLWFGENSPSAPLKELALGPIREATWERLARQIERVSLLTKERAEPDVFTVPTVLLHGSADQAVPLELGEALAAKASHGTLHVVELGAHALPVTHPSLVARYVFDQEC